MQEHQEFLTTPAAHQITVPDAQFQKLRHLLQGQVTHMMTVRVIHALEVINAQQHARLVALRHAFELVQHLPAAHGPGQQRHDH